MNITRGPLVERYADTFGLDVVEVLGWVNSYVNKPGEFPALIAAGLIEPSEKERAVSIKDYMQREVDNSVAGRIRSEIAEEKAAIRQFEGQMTRMEADRVTDHELKEAA